MAAGTVPDTSEKGFLGEKRDGIVKVILNPLTPQIRNLVKIRYHFRTITYADICPQGCRGEAEPVFPPAFQVSARLTPHLRRGMAGAMAEIFIMPHVSSAT